MFSACDKKVEEHTSKKSIVLSNGTHVAIEKTSTETTSIGILTKHNYGTIHTFKYRLHLKKNNVIWDLGTGEPKNLLICKDNLYIHYLNENSHRIEVKDTVTDSIQSSYITKVDNMYQKHIDERYFFKLLGEDYWLDVTSEEYSKLKKSCPEFEVPNDGELSI